MVCLPLRSLESRPSASGHLQPVSARLTFLRSCRSWVAFHQLRLVLNLPGKAFQFRVLNAAGSQPVAGMEEIFRADLQAARGRGQPAHDIRRREVAAWLGAARPAVKASAWPIGVRSTSRISIQRGTWAAMAARPHARRAGARCRRPRRDAAWPPRARQPASPAPTVTIPLQREATSWDEFIGRFAPSTLVEVRPRVSGAVTAVHFQDGQMVREATSPMPFVNGIKAVRERIVARTDDNRSEFPRKRGYTMPRPPLMIRLWPVMNRPSSAAR